MPKKKSKNKSFEEITCPGYNVLHKGSSGSAEVFRKNILINSISKFGAHCGPTYLEAVPQPEYLIHLMNIIKHK
jgi:hypothetical protein